MLGRGLLAAFLAVQSGLVTAKADEIDVVAEFDPCLACHSLDANVTGLPGPNLADLEGRRLGGDPDFSYSPVLNEAYGTGEVWNQTLLDRFLSDPEGMFPGMWMSYQGIDDPKTREALVDFILRGEGAGAG